MQRVPRVRPVLDRLWRGDLADGLTETPGLRIVEPRVAAHLVARDAPHVRAASQAQVVAHPQRTRQECFGNLRVLHGPHHRAVLQRRVVRQGLPRSYAQREQVAQRLHEWVRHAARRVIERQRAVHAQVVVVEAHQRVLWRRVGLSGGLHPASGLPLCPDRCRGKPVDLPVRQCGELRAGEALVLRVQFGQQVDRRRDRAILACRQRPPVERVLRELPRVLNPPVPFDQAIRHAIRRAPDVVGGFQVVDDVWRQAHAKEFFHPARRVDAHRALAHRANDRPFRWQVHRKAWGRFQPAGERRFNVRRAHGGRARQDAVPLQRVFQALQFRLRGLADRLCGRRAEAIPHRPHIPTAQDRVLEPRRQHALRVVVGGLLAHRGRGAWWQHRLAQVHQVAPGVGGLEPLVRGFLAALPERARVDRGEVLHALRLGLRVGHEGARRFAPRLAQPLAAGADRSRRLRQHRLHAADLCLRPGIVVLWSLGQHVLDRLQPMFGHWPLRERMQLPAVKRALPVPH